MQRTMDSQLDGKYTFFVKAKTKSDSACYGKGTVQVEGHHLEVFVEQDQEKPNAWYCPTVSMHLKAILSETIVAEEKYHVTVKATLFGREFTSTAAFDQPLHVPENTFQAQQPISSRYHVEGEVFKDEPPSPRAPSI